MSLTEYGWDENWARAFAGHRAQGFEPARITREDRSGYEAVSDCGPVTLNLTGKYRHNAKGKLELPAAGDWVAVELRKQERRGQIHALLPRRTCFVRKQAGTVTEVQVLAANVDTILIVCGLDHDLNLRRVERYLTLAWESGAAPVVALNKADLAPNAELLALELEADNPMVPFIPISAATGNGMDRIRALIRPGRTLALLGSSGVGKSTIVNSLFGCSLQQTQQVRAHDSHGRHTTTSRELMLLLDGGLVLDTPGMRELALWSDGDGLQSLFADISELAEHCRFRNCTHAGEPGCAVRAAVETGELDEGRLDSYFKLSEEERRLAIRTDEKAARIERERWKKISMMARKICKRKYDF